ncbi:MAG: flagellar export chaperone FlgN [Oscillospiraceae bacterium]|jgi:hypothetical protein|nr:flagellar export chaperone FlgN [Oscillospiraceae bacterium]
MTPELSESRARLIALLREECGLMGAFAQLADRQAAAIAQADEEAMAALWNESAEIIGRFDECRAQSNELAAHCRASGEPDGELRELEAQLEALARQAKSKNAANTAAARTKMTELGERINSMATSRKGVVSYASSGASGAETAMLFDRMT